MFLLGFYTEILHFCSLFSILGSLVWVKVATNQCNPSSSTSYSNILKNLGNRDMSELAGIYLYSTGPYLFILHRLGHVWNAHYINQTTKVDLPAIPCLVQLAYPDQLMNDRWPCKLRNDCCWPYHSLSWYCGDTVMDHSFRVWMYMYNGKPSVQEHVGRFSILQTLCTNVLNYPVCKCALVEFR